ncbi:MAG: hypothetical protein Q9195_005531 [Heterodermia aff. obscurata]
MDAISVTLGVAALFKTCIDSFEYFKAASALNRNFEVLLVKLDFEQERLLVWGDEIGIGKADIDDPEEIALHSDLTKRCLANIKNLLGDTEALKSRYGVRPVSSHDQNFERSGVSANALKRFRLRFGRPSREHSVLNRTRWAIHDAPKFQSLVSDLRDLIDGLTRQVPVPQDRLDQKVQDDIASMVDNISGLRLLQEACENQYPTWQKAASVAIDASEAGTVDDGLAHDRVGQYISDVPSDSSVPNRRRHSVAFGEKQKAYLHTKTRIFFVLTEQCITRNEESPCDQMRLGERSLLEKYSYVTRGGIRAHTAPGYRIGENIEPEDFTHIDLGQYLQNHESLRARAAENGEYLPEEVIRYKVKIYVYCSPCACQIATALDICKHTGTSPLVTLHIRIDYRQATSCCAPSSGIDGISSVIDHLKDIERKDNDFFLSSRVPLIDRCWLEQMEYCAGEPEEAPASSPESQMTRIVNYHSGAKDVAAVVILGEADYCVPLLGARPLPSFEMGSRFRENMMFMLEQTRSKALGRHWQRSYLGTYSSKSPIIGKPSLPATVDKRQSDDEPEEKNKRPKTMIDGQ